MDFHIMKIFLLAAVVRIHFIVTTKGKSVSDSPLSCRVKQHFQSQYVTPLLERISHVTGCTSQDISRNSKEVHVVSLESAGLNTTSLQGFLPRVSLKVKPRMENSLHVGPLVLVLNTATPVMWQLEVERISSNSRFVVFVTEASQVVPSVPLTLLVRQKQRAPLDKIVKWARSRFVALTSLSIIGIANTIVLKVGIDANYSETCEDISEKSVHNVEASFIQPQPASGCTVSENIGPTKRDVHVVKLMSTEEFSEIVVHLHPKGAAEARTSKIVVAKDLVLILKSDSAVKWRIGSWGIKGTVYVVAEHQVFPGSMPVFHLLQVQVRSLPLTLEELTSEVTDSNISTVIESWTVNRVNIMVVGEILGSNHYNVQSDGGSSRNKFSVGQDKAQPVLSHQKKLNTTAYPFTSWNHKIRNRNETGNVDENLTLELDSLTSLECRKNEIKVNFPKSSCMKIAAKLNGVNIGWLEVTLKDQECKARSNKTHYILETNLNSCGSSMVSDGRKYYYKNQVLFWAPVRPKGILGNQKDLRSEFDESFADDEDVISSDDGSGVGHHLKQVLANQQGITKSRLLFTQNILCVYNMTDGRSMPKEVNHPHVFHMDLYKDSNFQEELLRVNGSVEVLSQDNVYVKTAIEAGPDLFVVTDECWLSLTNNSFVITENREVLIQHSCSKHLSVGLLGVERHGSRSPEELSYPQRFFFHITQRWIGHKVFLHCRLAVCSNKANSPLHGVKQCIDPKDYCEGYDVKQVSESQTEQHFSVQVEGPIHVLPSRKTQGKDSTAPFLFNYLPVMDKNLDRISPVVKSDVRAGSCTSHVMMELSTAAIVGIAFASFLIGAGLVVVLWFIHLHTDPSQRTRARQQRDVRHRHHHSGYDLSGHSGSSTPSSQAPMTVHACA